MTPQELKALSRLFRQFEWEIEQLIDETLLRETPTEVGRQFGLRLKVDELRTRKQRVSRRLGKRDYKE